MALKTWWSNFIQFLSYANPTMPFSTVVKALKQEPFFKALKIKKGVKLVSITEMLEDQQPINLVCPDQRDISNVYFMFPVVENKTDMEQESILNKVIEHNFVPGYTLGILGLFDFEDNLLNTFYEQALKAGFDKIDSIKLNMYDMRLPIKVWRLIFGKKYLGPQASSFTDVFAQAVMLLSDTTVWRQYLKFAREIYPAVQDITCTKKDPRTSEEVIYILKEAIYEKILWRQNDRETRLFMDALKGQDQDIINKIQSQIKQETSGRAEHFSDVISLFSKKSKQKPVTNPNPPPQSGKQKSASKHKEINKATASETKQVQSETKPEPKEPAPQLQEAQNEPENPLPNTTKKKKKKRNRNKKKKTKQPLESAFSHNDQDTTGLSNTEKEAAGYPLKEISLQSDWDIYQEEMRAKQNTEQSLVPINKDETGQPIKRQQKSSLVKTLASQIKSVISGKKGNMAKQLWKKHAPPRIIGTYSEGGVNFNAAVTKLLRTQEKIQQNVAETYEILKLTSAIKKDSDEEWLTLQHELEDFDKLYEDAAQINAILLANFSWPEAASFSEQLDQINAEVEALRWWPEYLEFAEKVMVAQDNHNRFVGSTIAGMLQNSDHQLDLRKAEQFDRFQSIDRRLYLISQSEMFANLGIIQRQREVMKICYGRLKNIHDEMMLVKASFTDS